MLKRDYPNIKILETDGMRSNIAAVITGKADAMVDALAVVSYYMQFHGISGLQPAFYFDTKSTQDQMYMGVRKGAPLLKNILNKALRELSHEKRQEISERWISFKKIKKGSGKNAIALTDQERQWILTHQQVTLSGNPDRPPYSFYNDSGK